MTVDAARPQPRILIVDDQDDIRKLLRMTLEGEPYELHEAADGDQAWQSIQALAPELVLLDVMLPGKLDGLQVCQRVRSEPRLAATRVLLLSARADASDSEAGLKAGADGYITKPFRPLQLIETVELMLRGRVQPAC